MKKKQFFPAHKKAPPSPVEPEDIAQDDTLSDSEKKILADTIASFSGATVALPAYHQEPIGTIKAEIRNEHAGLHPAFTPSPESKAALEKAIAIEKAELAEKQEAIFSSDRDELANAFETIAVNLQIGADLFNLLPRKTIAKVVVVYQKAICALLISGETLAPLDLRALVALSLRGQEDRHNRRALLDLCARLDITAEELTLALLRDNLSRESWRLGEAAAEIPNLEPTPENELLWREYKAELGLVKRRVAK